MWIASQSLPSSYQDHGEKVGVAAAITVPRTAQTSFYLPNAFTENFVVHTKLVLTVPF
jgi:hypothetical protein